MVVDLSNAGGFAESVELFQVLIDAVDSAQHVSESVLSVKRERRRFMHPGKEIRNKRFRRIGITGI